MTHAVLLVEDDEDLREGLAALLEHEGHRVTTAANGREALETLSAMQPPCLIILDLMMPIMDGWTMRAELLKDPVLSHVPVVLLSGVADLQNEVSNLRAVDCLPKPVKLDQLYRVIGQHCSVAHE